MPQRSHRFVDTYEGLVGFGLDRKTDEDTVMYYLQAFSDDDLMRVLIPRMSDADLSDLFSRLSHLLKKYLRESEYHQFFLKDREPEGPKEG